MENVLIYHTAELDEATLAAARRLCDATFGDDFTDANWEHALGGVHALRFEGDRLVAHGALVARRLLHDGRSLRTGYVEALAVASDRQRRGYGAAVMAILHHYVERAYALGALASSDVGASLYLALGWTRWTSPRAVLALDDPVGFQNVVMLPDQLFQAADSYSLRSPPRIGRRRILPWTGSGTGDVGHGGRSRSARCGRAAL